MGLRLGLKSVRTLGSGEDVEEEVAAAGAGVPVQQQDLLPGPQEELSLLNGKAEGETQEAGPQVGMGVFLSPGQVVAVLPLPGDQAFQEGPEVGQGARPGFLV